MLNTPMGALVVVVVFVVGNAFLFFAFYLPRTPVPISDPVLVGAGDIADCASSGDEATAKLLDDVSGTVYTTGDNAYESGAPSEFAECYDPTWGRFKAMTHPIPGNLGTARNGRHSRIRNPHSGSAACAARCGRAQAIARDVARR